jgi:Resolvase, N terminal domain
LAQYQTLRSVSDHHVFVVCRDGRFYEHVPEVVRKLGPWHGNHHGEIDKPEFDDLEARGVSFMTTEDGLSTKGSTGKLVLNVLGAIAQFERSLIMERTRAGLASAKERGAVFGRRRKLAPADIARARELLTSGELKTRDVAAMLKVSQRTLFRELKDARERDEMADA